MTATHPKEIMAQIQQSLKSGDQIAAVRIVSDWNRFATNAQRSGLVFEATQEPGLLDFVVSQGIDIDARSKDGVTTLHSMAGFADDGGADVVAQLLRLGADANAADVDGETPISYAACNTPGSPRTIELLARYGADVGHARNDGITALHIACNLRDPIGVEALIRCKAPVNVQSDDGNTPLHLSVCMFPYDGNPWIVRALVHAGADLNIRNQRGITPAEMLAAWGVDVDELLARS